MAEHAEPVEGRNTHGPGEVAVRAAARAAMGEDHAGLGREVLRQGVEGERSRIRLPDRPRDAPADGEAHAVLLAGEGEHPLDHPVEVRLALGHAERLPPAQGRHAIHPHPAGDDTRRDGALGIREGVDGEDLARHGADRGAPLARRRARMARPADRLQVEPGDGVAARHHPVAGLAGLRHEHVGMPRRLGLDQVAGGGAADLLVAGEQHRHRQGRLRSGGDQGAQRGDRDDVAALHVEDARPVGAVALHPPGQARECAHGMDRIQMAEDEDALLVALRMREARPHAIAEAHPAGDRLHLRADQREVAGGQRHHAVDGERVVGRALALDPGAQLREQGLGGEVQVTGHRAASGAGPAKGSSARGQKFGSRFV